MIIEVLERDLPPATLLLGPDPEQLVRAAVAALRKHSVVPADRAVLRHVSAADARGIVKFAQTAPFGPFKAVIARLDGSAAQAQNILLKVLEEPPDTIRFILVATQRPLPTVVSRCQVITVPIPGPTAEPDADVSRQVTTALTAAAAGDLAGLDKALAGWGDEQHAVLSAMVSVAANAGAHGLTRHQGRRLIGALSRYSGAHPRLAAHAALVTVFADKS